MNTKSRVGVAITGLIASVSLAAGVAAIPFAHADQPAPAGAGVAVAQKAKKKTPSNAQHRLSVYGIGQIRVGTKYTTLDELGHAKWSDSEAPCMYWAPSKALLDKGIAFDDSAYEYRASLTGVVVTSPKIKTLSGAHVGMTIKQIKARYGSKFKIVAKQNHGKTIYVGSMRSGSHELQFRVPGKTTRDMTEYAPQRPLRDSDVVREITAQRYTQNVTSGGC